MKELHLEANQIWRDQNVMTRSREIYLKNGPLISRVKDAGDNLEVGSLLFGEFKVTSESGEGTARYTLVQLPNGKKYPICMEGIIQSGYVQEGVVEAGSYGNIFAVNSWKRPW